MNETGAAEGTSSESDKPKEPPGEVSLREEGNSYQRVLEDLELKVVQEVFESNVFHFKCALSELAEEYAKSSNRLHS